MNKIILAGLMSALMPLGAMAEGDVDAGEKVFKKCKACHAVGPNAKNRVGPVLNGIVGREVAIIEGYKYSKAMKASELTWDVETLTIYLANPRKFVKGTKMAFAGLKKDDDLENVIAYLAQFDLEGNITE
ncbi:cytochrome c family protein [Pararhizobium sp. IMCC21322]|uniref:c-type cytochrome n=1 Tax=Pararhizobium sp. IMCC21322 TaxID=3067903 RepID=UPI0027423B79|nr:cytochrome c family protein [Pararhizobium sp. IMCC21322]